MKWKVITAKKKEAEEVVTKVGNPEKVATKKETKEAK